MLSPGYPGISVVIPTWNGLHLLEAFLPSVLAAVRNYQKNFCAPVEVIVVDDASSDNTVGWLEKHFFQQINLIRRSRNGGFSAACNTGFRSARFPLVLLLNNDVDIEEDFFTPLVEHFTEDQVFAVTPKVFDLDRRLFCNGGKVGHFRHGFWSMFANYDPQGETGREMQEQRRLLSASAIGGFSMFDRNKLNSLRGFDELMSPYHWEDNDLSYRAWKRGWEIHYEPRALAYHNASSTIQSHFHKKHVALVSTRNRLLFHWKNLHSPTMFLGHLAMVGFLFLTGVLRFDWTFYRAFTQALRRLPALRPLRRLEKKEARVTDRELKRKFLQYFKSPGLCIVRNREEARKISSAKGTEDQVPQPYGN